MCVEGFLVTYCAKGQVRRDLKSVGFKMERLPEQYWLQCQQQLLVTQSDKLYFWVYDAKSAAGLLQIVIPHKETQANIVNALNICSFSI